MYEPVFVENTMSIYNNQFQTLISQVYSQVLHVVYCSFRTKIRIHPHRVGLLLRLKSFSHGIFNVHNIIRSEDGFKGMLFPHIYCNTQYVKIRFINKSKVENIVVHLYFFFFFSFYITAFQFLCTIQTLFEICFHLYP